MTKRTGNSSVPVVAEGAPTCSSQRLGWTSCCAAIALASALLSSAAVPVLAEEPNPPDPTADHVWAGCVLGSDYYNNTLEALRNDISNGAGMDDDLQIAFVVVYALNNDNDGQPLDDGDDEEEEEEEGQGEQAFTGPIICRNSSLVGIETTSQTADIPPPSTGADSVDTLDAEDVFILRYVLNGGGEGIDGTEEKVICHTVDENTDCFRISPLIGGD